MKRYIGNLTLNVTMNVSFILFSKGIFVKHLFGELLK